MARKSVRKPEVKLKQINHPNSRKAKQLAKQTNKAFKRNKSKLNHQMKLNTLGEKMLFFRDKLNSGSTVCTPSELAEIIDKYLGRFNDELEQIKLKHSIGQRQRQHASREDAIKLTMSNELEEYNTCGIVNAKNVQMGQNNLLISNSIGQNIKSINSNEMCQDMVQWGFELPDLSKESQVKLLQEWNGEIRFIQNFKLRRFRKNVHINKEDKLHTDTSIVQSDKMIDE